MRHSKTPFIVSHLSHFTPTDSHHLHWDKKPTKLLKDSELWVQDRGREPT